MYEAVENGNKNNREISMSWIDTDCYPEFLSYFNVRLHELPKLFAINTKTEKYIIKEINLYLIGIQA